MNPRTMLSAAAASLMTAVLAASPATAHEPGNAPGQEKCYGVAPAGQNDCASLSGLHSCAGQSKVANAPDEWKYVAKGTCSELKGMTAAQARAKLGKKAPASVNE